ncbi:MAG: glycosyltransferase family 4 protein [Candidatus Hydrogenedentes bacterium]|nr:glycosyltransferase family 4 protein [Candidatus Hydrogenedentota bacterium]
MPHVKDPIRVLHLAESPYFGGINAHICSVVRAFRDRPGVTISVATLPGVHADRWLFDVLGEKYVYELPMASRFDFSVTKRLREYVAREEIDVVHTHNYRATLVASRAKLPIPVVNTSHGMVIDGGLKVRAYQWLELHAMRNLRATVAVSGFVNRWLVSRGVPREKLRTIHNGYEPEPNSRDLDRRTLGIANDATVYLFVGRLAHGKGIREFIDALRGIDGAHAVIVGDGPLRGDSEAVAHAARVAAHFAGIQRDVTPYYRFADVVVLPSRMEALPMTLIEAAAHGKPVVASNVGGIPEVVADSETGLLVKTRDRAQLHDALRKLTNADLRARLGAAAYARWRERFTLNDMADALHSLYREAVG